MIPKKHYTSPFHWNKKKTEYQSFFIYIYIDPHSGLNVLSPGDA